MADFRRPSLELTSPSPKPPENDVPAEMSLGNDDQNSEGDNGAPASGSANGDGNGPGSPTEGLESQAQKQVKEVLASDV